MLPPLILLALAALLLSPGLFVGPSLDPAVFVHVASELRNGEALYVGTWDHKPPGIFLLYAAAQAVLPFVDPWVVAWVLSVIATAATGWLVAWIGRRMGVTSGIALLAGSGAVIAMAQYLTALGGGLTEPIASVPLVAALAFAVAEGGVRRVV
ncbi:MAG TPA: hypothetical protein VHK28_04485, partial [Candidatus Limnocylindria bacterium]|nr:hypothetical protein [Candidatus Limnocylindria bacterium]